MRQRTTLVLAAFFFIGLAALWWADSARLPTAAQRRAMLNRILPDLIDVPTGDVVRIKVERGAETLDLERREDGGWQLRRPIDVAADPERVETLVKNLKELRKSPDSGTITGDPAPYGLGRPEAVVRVYVKGQERPAGVLDFGKAVQDRQYVRPGDGGIEVVDRRLFEALGAPLNDWRDRGLLSFATFKVEGFTLAGPAVQDAEGVKLARQGEGWRLSEPVAAPADRDRAEGLLAELGALRVVDGVAGFVADGVAPEGLAAYGLGPPALTVRVEPFDGAGPPQVLRLGKPTAQGSDEVYAVRGGQDDVVRVDAKGLRGVLREPLSLRSRKAVDFAPARAGRLRIETPERVFDLVRNGESWELLEPAAGRADAAALRAFLTALRGLEASAVLKPGAVAEPRLEKPAQRVRVWYEGGVASAALPAETPAVDLRLGRHDLLRKTVYGQVGGDRSLLALPDVFLGTLPQNEFAYRDRTVLALNPAAVAALTVERGEKAVTVVAPGSRQTATRWKMTVPVEGPADEAAVTGLLTVLQGLTAESWVGTLRDSGAGFGLQPPWLRVKWELGGAPLTGKGPGVAGRTGALRVGKEKRDSPHFYANVEGEATVFTLSQRVVASLQPELRDRSVLSVPAGSARRVDFLWPKRSLAVEPENAGAWRPVPGYDASGFDVGLVGPFLATLTDFKTPRFLQYEGPIPAASGLNPPLFVARVTLVAGGKSRVVELKVGRRLGDTPQRAASTAAGASGAVFILPTSALLDRLFEVPTREGELPEDVFAPLPSGAVGPS